MHSNIPRSYTYSSQSTLNKKRSGSFPRHRTAIHFHTPTHFTLTLSTARCRALQKCTPQYLTRRIKRRYVVHVLRKYQLHTPVSSFTRQRQYNSTLAAQISSPSSLSPLTTSRLFKNDLLAPSSRVAYAL